MRLSRPRSLIGLVFFGFVLVAVPLLAAIVHAVVQLNRQANHSTTLVQQSVQATRYNRQLVEHITAMERSARLYVALGDSELLGVYEENSSRFGATIDALDDAISDAEVKRYLQQLRTGSRILLTTLTSELPPGGRPPDIAARFREFSRIAGEVSERSSAEIDRQLLELQSTTQRTQQTLAWQTAALIPGTLILALLFTLVIARPIRQIDHAISALGKGTFSQPIEVRGPRDLETLGRQLEWLRMRLLDLAQEKNRFLRHMSHELKTPLANIREGTELLIDGTVGELDSNQREVATILRDSSLKLQQLIENLLSFSAWQAQNTGLDLTRFQLRRLIKTVLAHQQLTMVSQRVRLNIKVDDLTIFADRQKLRLILDNLISNAIKFTPVGGTIYIGATADEDQLIVEVADNGPGIPVEERSRIFAAFYQGRTPQGGQVRGTGIGLSVVAEFVNAHGGSIEIVDGNYPGAHFRIRLPLEQKLRTEQVLEHA